MEQPDNSNHWRRMFDQGRRDAAPNGMSPSPGDSRHAHGGGARPFGYDDGYDPGREAGATRQQAPSSPETVTDEAALALALDSSEYRPWILQRGRSRPALMLHLRRYEQKSGLWVGWQVAYSHLVAVEYVGDTMLSLDFGTRQFVIQGTGLNELTRHLQAGSVLLVQEWAKEAWISQDDVNTVNSINHTQFK